MGANSTPKEEPRSAASLAAVTKHSGRSGSKVRGDSGFVKLPARRSSKAVKAALPRSFARVTELTNRLGFESYNIDNLIDNDRRFNMAVDPEFPIAIKLVSFFPVEPSFRISWHEQLEIFVAVEGEIVFRMGDQTFGVSPGDAVIVDTVKLHGLDHFRGRNRKGILIYFDADFVYNIGSPVSDYTFLTPFYCQIPGVEPVLRSTDRLATGFHRALGNLLESYAEIALQPDSRIGCKVYLLEMLYHFVQRFGRSEVMRSHYLRQRETSQKLGELFDFVKQNYSQRIAVARAASIVGMSESCFMRFFKQATGETFVSWLNSIRLSNGYRFVAETDRPIGEVALAVGFPDQSYFDKKFRQHFRKSPLELRREMRRRNV